MKNIRFNITIDISYTGAENSGLGKSLMQKLEDNFQEVITKELLGFPNNCELSSWGFQARVVNPEQEQAVCKSERITPFAHINAYFSADGPAVAVDIHGIPLGAASDAMELTLSDINGALREAHQRYLASLREG